MRGKMYKFLTAAIFKVNFLLIKTDYTAQTAPRLTGTYQRSRASKSVGNAKDLFNSSNFGNTGKNYKMK